MARFDEGLTVGNEALRSLGWLAVLFAGFYVAEWVGMTTDSLFASSLLGFAIALVHNYLPGAEVSESDEARVITPLSRALLGLYWLIVLAAAGFVTVKFVAQIEVGMDNRDATLLGFLAGAIVRAIGARSRSRKLTERQFSQ